MIAKIGLHDTRIVDYSGRNYLIFEWNFDFLSLFIPIQRWFHVKQNNVKTWFTKLRYGTYSKVGRGTWVWRDGCWVPGKADDRSIFHTFFDYGMSKFVSSTAEIKAKEKEGFIYTTHNEAERESAKRKFELKQEKRAKIRKSVEDALVGVARGRKSYYRDHLKQMPEDMRLRAERMRAAKVFR